MSKSWPVGLVGLCMAALGIFGSRGPLLPFLSYSGANHIKRYLLVLSIILTVCRCGFGAAFENETHTGNRSVGRNTGMRISDVRNLRNCWKQLNYDAEGMECYVDAKNRLSYLCVVHPRKAGANEGVARQVGDEVIPGVGAYGLMLGEDVARIKNKEPLALGTALSPPTADFGLYSVKVKGTRLTLYARENHITRIKVAGRFMIAGGIRDGSDIGDVLRIFGSPDNFAYWLVLKKPNPHRTLIQLLTLLLLGVASGAAVSSMSSKVDRPKLGFFVLAAMIGIIGNLIPMYVGTVMAGGRAQRLLAVDDSFRHMLFASSAACGAITATMAAMVMNGRPLGWIRHLGSWFLILAAVIGVCILIFGLWPGMRFVQTRDVSYPLMESSIFFAMFAPGFLIWRRK